VIHNTQQPDNDMLIFTKKAQLTKAEGGTGGAVVVGAQPSTLPAAPTASLQPPQQ